MKEEVINKLLEKSLNYLETAEAFASKEIPQFIQELLTFKFIEHFAQFCVLTIFLIVSIKVSHLMITKGLAIMNNNKEVGYREESEAFIPLLIIGPIIALFIIPISMSIKSETISMYKAKYAPRVYLLDYARNR